jgi:nicotinate-nucleotide pyrophosphorylase (carboxylating)
VYESGLVELLDLAVVEDLGRGDVTSNALIPKSLQVKGRYLAGGRGVIAGLGLLRPVFRRFGRGVRVKPLVADGARVRPGQPVAAVSGPARVLLAGERLSLNLLCRLSGVATLTARYVERTRGTRARIFDTRKTTPGMRALEKYAVTVGGGHNHRMGLFDAVLVKDNHLSLAGRSIAESVRLAGRRGTRPVEVEVTDMAGLDEAVKAGADAVMLDNFRPAAVAAAVKRARRLAAGRGRRGRRLEIEVSGGVTLATVRRLAEAGPDRISVGALTHSAPALDISLELERLSLQVRDSVI